MLLNLPALTDPAHPDRALPAGGGSGSGPLVDQLFFQRRPGRAHRLPVLAQRQRARAARSGQPARRAAPATGHRRSATISEVVETLQDAGSALAGNEPYHAFTGINGIELWHWPTTRRTEPGAKMHAKLAFADRHILLITSANLTQSGVSNNIEAGLLIRGGTAPVRAAEHVDSLRASGDLIRLT
jgi:phosphatidylserine/phosphatidylglycerophosphate/cardiolipin synthase-like enzyme